MPDDSRGLRRALKYAAISGFIAVAVAVVWTLGPGAGWVLRHVDDVRGLRGKDLEDALDKVRGRALAVATGLAALLAVYYTARNADTARRSFQLGEQGQVTERYTKAIEQLGSDKPDIRIGGIYALERIAADSARDHPVVMEVLATFVREHVSLRPDFKDPAKQVSRLIPAADIQAALTVLGRRTTANDTRRLNLSATDLRHVDLRGADLGGADLGRADLRLTDLSGARLDGADLRGAGLGGATLSGARLDGADLRLTDLSGAHLVGARLDGARLDGARLDGARLDGARLDGADLSAAKLSDATFEGARYSATTKWPEAFSGPPQRGTE